MSNLSLHRGDVSEPVALFELLKEMFCATPLGLMLTSLARR